MDATLERLVRQRAGGRCEYCRLPQAGTQVPIEIDHIIARKHRGRTLAGNLALSCYYCNVYKGPNLTGRDPATGKVTPALPSPPSQMELSFPFRGQPPIGRTAIGRTTIDVLRMNHPQLVALRDLLLAAGII